MEEIIFYAFTESLRIIFIGPGAQRVCTQDFLIPDTSIWIRKRDTVVIPISAILSDAENFQNPNIFDPERFIGKNLSNIRPNAYIPFSQGPKMCPGETLFFSVLFGQLGTLSCDFYECFTFINIFHKVELVSSSHF